jgi:hypothetical protein
MDSKSKILIINHRSLIISLRCHFLSSLSVGGWTIVWVCKDLRFSMYSSSCYVLVLRNTSCSSSRVPEQDFVIQTTNELRY